MEYAHCKISNARNVWQMEFQQNSSNHQWSRDDIGVGTYHISQNIFMGKFSNGRRNIDDNLLSTATQRSKRGSHRNSLFATQSGHYLFATPFKGTVT